MTPDSVTCTDVLVALTVLSPGTGKISHLCRKCLLDILMVFVSYKGAGC